MSRPTLQDLENDIQYYTCLYTFERTGDDGKIINEEIFAVSPEAAQSILNSLEFDPTRVQTFKEQK